MAERYRKPKDALRIRLSLELGMALRKRAMQERRPLGKQVELIIVEWLERDAAQAAEQVARQEAML